MFIKKLRVLYSRLKHNVYTLLNPQIKFKRILKSELYIEKSLNSTESLVKINNSNEKVIVVSLTTYSKRINDVHLVIESIGQQSRKANRIILWLDEDEFNSETLPQLIKNQISRGLEVKYCSNIKSYKKLIPTLLMNLECDIITIDDDILYPYYMIERLEKESLLYPGVIVCNRAHYIKLQDGKINEYKKWEFGTSYSKPSNLVFPVGVGGVLYPANSLHRESTNIDSFMSLAPNADDVWFKAMSIKNGVLSKRICSSEVFDEEFISILNNQDIALSGSNLTNDGNNLQISQVFSKYGIENLL